MNVVKCSLDNNSIKRIQTKIDNIFRSYLKEKQSISTLKEAVQKFLIDTKEQYTIVGNEAMVVDLLHNRSIRYGVEAQNPDFFSKLNITNLLTAYIKDLEINPLDTSTDNLTDTEQIKRKFEANREFLDNAYGLAKEVSTYVENETNKSLFDCLFINRGSINLPLGIVRTNIDLNRNIREYLESLLNKITSYLSKIVKDAPNLHTSKDIKLLLQSPKLYLEINGKIQNTGILETILLLSNMYLSSTNFNTDILRQLFNNMNDSSLPLSKREDAKQKLEAYNAKVILDHFDTYLTIILGKSIWIKDFNNKTGEDKYQISRKSANIATTWRVTDNIFVEDEIDNITKLAINTTPYIKWLLSTPVNSLYIKFQDFEYIIAKIKDLVFNEKSANIIFDDSFLIKNRKLWESFSEKTRSFLKNKSLRTVINLIRKNPRLYLNSIFEILSHEDFYNLYSTSIYKDFTNDLLNKLYSISRGIFNGSNSIYELSDYNADNDYYSYITLVADTVFGVNYLQYYKDEEGIINIRTLIDLSVNTINRNIETTINTRNSRKLIKNFNDYCTNLDLKPNSNEDFKSITFIIPNTNIKVKVIASSGSVLFYDNSTGTVILNFLQLWKDDNIKLFIDNILHINIKNTRFLESLNDIIKTYSDICKDLLSFSSRVILNLYVSNTYIKDDTKENIEHIINYIYGNNAPKYNYSLDELSLIHGNDISTLKKLALAKANLYGITTLALIKNGVGDGQSAYTLSRLLGSLLSLFELLEKQSWSASKDSMLFNIEGLYEGFYTAKEFYYNLKNKEFTDMTVSEMSYAGLIHDFVRGFLPVDGVVGDGHVLFLPSVFSDKGIIGRIRINLNKQVNIKGKLKSIKELNSEELEYIISLEFGKFYTNIYNEIINNYRILDLYLQKNGINIPIKLSDDFINGFLNFNKYYLDNIDSLIQYGKNPVEFIKNITLNYNKTSRFNPVELVDQVHYRNNKGNLSINEVFIALIARFNPQFLLNIKRQDLIQKYPTSKLFWLFKKAEVLKTLLKSNFKVNTSNIRLLELKHIKDNFPEWINSSGNLILARAIINNKVVDITSSKDILKISEQNVNDVIDNVINTIILNPIIELYNYLDYLFTLLFMNATVGSFIAHPPKGVFNTVLEEEAALFLAQHKRNVSFTASMHPFLINLLNGIPEYYNIAVIEDIKDELGTILGLLNFLKPFDGATFVNPFVVLLENFSLGGAKAGITKKQFIHFKNERTGTGGMIKTAGFGLTNDWIRNSPFLDRMMKKMTNHIWLDKNGNAYITDITKDFKGDKIKYKDFYYKKNGNFYKITNIEYLGNNTYKRTIQLVESDGSFIKDMPPEDPIIIDSNYKLWNFFGGANSMVLERNSLKLSNTSVENVVIAMNNIGEVIGEGKIETLEQLWLPLKMVDVHYVATAGAVKQGAANINSASKYHDNEDYDIQRIKVYLAGILLDKEHHADNSELSLMTLVISACAAKGYTIDTTIKLYDALRKATEIGTKDHLEAVKLLFTDGTELSIELFLEVLIKSIIGSLGSSSKVNNNFAQIIALDLIKLAKEGKLIKFSEVLLPLSDNTVYAKIFSTISSYLTNTGIKQKVPGILSVLTPSFNIFKLYNDRKYESFTDPVKELEEILKNLPSIYRKATKLDVLDLSNALHNPESAFVEGTPEFKEASKKAALILQLYNLDLLSLEEIENIYSNGYIELSLELINLVTKAIKNNNISNLELGRNYFITKNIIQQSILEDGSIVETIVPYTKSILIRTPKEYILLREDIKNGIVTKVIEDITVGRDLAGYNCRFTSIEGDSFLIWDLNSSLALFELDELKKQWKNSEENILKLLKIYKDLFGIIPNISFDSALSLLHSMIIRANRMLLNDIENLSLSTPDTKEQYYKFLNTRLDTTEWYNKYAEWVNIKLKRGDGKKLFLKGKYILVDSNNFNEIEKIVSNILDTTTKVRINGKYYTIDKSSIIINPYEIIMPKTFATAFGLKEFDDLETIKNNPDFFVELYLLNYPTKVNKNQYTIEFKNSNGDHYYLLTKNLITNSNLIKIEPLILNEDGKTYRLDANQNIMYEISPDTEIYLDNSGNEVIVTDLLDFYIDNLSYDYIKLSEELINSPSLIRTITKLLKKSSNQTANLYYKDITAFGNTPLNIMKYNSYYNSITLENYKNNDNALHIIKIGRLKHTSFLKSLDIIAARIPALSMLSFMPMKIVAFDNPNINTAHVSTYLILLLGSDYDIDAVSLATYDIDNNGLLLLWSPYSNINNLELMEASMELPLPSGLKTLLVESNNIENPINFINKYRDIFTINESMIYNNNTNEYELDPTKVKIGLILNTTDKIKLFKEFLIDIKTLTRLLLDSVPLMLTLAKYLMDSGIVTFRFKKPMQIISIFDGLQDIANKHNLYFDNISRYKLSKIINNYSMHSIYNIACDPVNLILAHTPIDNATSPLKKIADNSLEGQEAKFRTPGNAFNKFLSIVENLTGKKGIGICAVGLKAFFALTLYNNYILNYGTSEQLSRLLLNYNHRGHIIGGDLYQILANIRSKDPNSITNDDVLEALASVTNDHDAAIVLSALLSLATDFRKLIKILY